MTTYREMIQGRHGRRVAIEREQRNLRVPSLHSKAAFAAFKKEHENLAEKFKEECLLVTHDHQVMQVALYNIGLMYGQEIVDQEINAAWNNSPLADDVQEALYAKENEEREARERAERSDKKQGELKGQMKIPFDDGSTAEGGEVKTTKCDADGNPIDENEESRVILSEYLDELLQPIDLTLMAKQAIAEDIEMSEMLFDSTLAEYEVSDAIRAELEEVVSKYVAKSHELFPLPKFVNEEATADLDAAQAELDESPSRVEQLAQDVEQIAQEMNEPAPEVNAEAEPVNELAKAAKKKAAKAKAAKSKADK